MSAKREGKTTLPANSQAVAKAKCVDGKRTTYRIEDVRGLVLTVQPGGEAAWGFRYSMGGRAQKRERWIALGTRDATSLAEARAKAIELRRRVEAGEDVVAVARERASAITFRELAERFLAEGGKAPRTVYVYGHALRLHVFPAFGDKPAHEVTRDDIVRICTGLEKRGHHVTSEKLKSTMGGVYRWGVRNGLVAASPVIGIGSRIPNHERKVVRTRAPSDDELAAVWHGLEREDVAATRTMRDLVRLIVLTGQRRSEVAGMMRGELQEVDGRLVWVIPGDTRSRGKVARGRTKNGREQRVPLSRQAERIVRERLASTEGDYLFPARREVTKVGKEPRTPHINGESVTRCLVRMRPVIGVEGLTIHDFRRAVSTWLKDGGVSREVRDLVLNHTDPSVTERHYSGAARMEVQVARALQDWADHVSRVVGEAAESGGGNVVALRAG